jgi:DNA modification methylase
MKLNIKEIKLNDHNPRDITPEMFEKLKKSIQEFPQMLETRPLVIDENNVVLGGNMRLRALTDLGYEEIPVQKVEGWSEEQKKEFIVKDNVSYGVWDWELLANQWDAVQLEDWGLEVPGFEEEELEAKEDNFEIPYEIQTDIQLGDIIEIGEHRLMCGDSTCSDTVAKLMNGEKADMVFTSPPYNGDTHLDIGKGAGRLYNDKEMDNKTSKDYITFLQSTLDNILLYTNGFIFWNINYNAKSRNEYLKHLVPYFNYLWETIIWEKTGMPIADGLTRNCEFIFVLKNGERKHLGKHFETSHNLWKISNLNSQDLKNNHRACFPVELPNKGINLGSEANDLVYEPFTGSGSTMVASHQLNRKCYGMELDPKYCQVIVDRMIKLDPELVIKKNGELYISGN